MVSHNAISIGVLIIEIILLTKDTIRCQIFVRRCRTSVSVSASLSLLLCHRNQWETKRSSTIWFQNIWENGGLISGLGSRGFSSVFKGFTSQNLRSASFFKNVYTACNLFCGEEHHCLTFKFYNRDTIIINPSWLGKLRK